MAIAINNLGASTGTTEAAPDIRVITDLFTYTLASWDPPNDGVVVLAIMGANNAGDLPAPIVTGNSDAWAYVADHGGYPDPITKQLWIYAGYGASLSTGVTTLDFTAAATTLIGCYVSVFHITGANESGPVNESPWGLASGSISDPTVGAATGFTIDYDVELNAPFSHANNRPLIFSSHNTNEQMSIDAGWVKIDDMQGAGPAVSIITAWDSDGQAEPTMSWATSSLYAWILMEIVADTSEPATFRPINRRGR